MVLLAGASLSPQQRRQWRLFFTLLQDSSSEMPGWNIVVWNLQNKGHSTASKGCSVYTVWLCHHNPLRCCVSKFKLFAIHDLSWELICNAIRLSIDITLKDVQNHPVNSTFFVMCALTTALLHNNNLTLTTQAQCFRPLLIQSKSVSSYPG